MFLLERKKTGILISKAAIFPFDFIQIVFPLHNVSGATSTLSPPLTDMSIIYEITLSRH